MTISKTLPSRSRGLLTSTALGFGVFAVANGMMANAAYSACVGGNPGVADFVCTGVTTGGLTSNTGAASAPTVINNGTIVNTAGNGLVLSSTSNDVISVQQNPGDGNSIIGTGTGLAIDSQGGIRFTGNGTSEVIGQSSGYAAFLKDNSDFGILFVGDNLSGARGGIQATENGNGRIDLFFSGPFNGNVNISTEVGIAVEGKITSATNDEDIRMDIRAIVAGNAGIRAQSDGTGNISLRFNGEINATQDRGILGFQNNNIDPGNVEIFADGVIRAVNNGIYGLGGSNIYIENNATIFVDGAGIAARSINNSNIEIYNGGTIWGSESAVGTLDFGILANSVVVPGSTGDIYINNQGNIGRSIDRATLNGIRAGNNDVGPNGGDISVYNGGSVFAVSDAIFVENNREGGTGSIDVRHTAGRLDSEQGFGINAEILASDNTSNVAIKVDNADVLGGQGGLNASNFGSGSIEITNLAGQIEASLANGIAINTFTESGLVEISNKGLIKSFAGKPNEIAIQHETNTPAGDLEILNEGDGTILGRIISSAGDDTITNLGIWRTAGDNSFGGNSGDQLVNYGLIDASGLSIGQQSNTTLDGLGGGFIAAVAGANITLSDQAIGDGSNISDRLTIDGDYSAANGAQVTVDAFLGGAGSLADFVKITGDVVANGTTFINIIDTNAGGGALNTSGIEVVKVNGTVAANAFALQNGPINKGLFIYDLTFDASAQIFKLISITNEAAASETLVAVTSSQDLWHDTMAVWADRQSSVREAVSNDTIVTAVADPVTPGAAAQQSTIWMAASGLRSKHDGSTVTDPGYKQSSLFLTGGADFGTQMETGTLMFGLMGGYIDSNVNLKTSTTDIEFKGGSLGAYANYLNQGLFLNATVKADLLDMDIKSSTGSASTDVSSVGMRGDAGYRFDYGQMFVEPSVSLAVAHTSIDDYTLAGATISSGGNTSVRLGGSTRIGMNANGFEASLSARVWDELGKAPQINVSSTSITSANFGGVFGEVGAHLKVDVADGVAAFADTTLQFGKDDHALTAQGGLNVSF